MLLQLTNLTERCYIYVKFKKLIFKNLNKQNLLDIIDEQFQILQQGSQSSFSTQFQNIILQIAHDEIRNSNIRLDQNEQRAFSAVRNALPS